MKKPAFILFLTLSYLSLLGSPALAASDILYFLHTDHLGSTRAITDRDGNVVARYDYWPYGTTSNEQLTTSSQTVERLFTSQIQDGDSNLYFYNSRYYNPALGTFISPDPVQGPNRYAYVSNNPINMIDPSGNQGRIYLPVILKEGYTGEYALGIEQLQLTREYNVLIYSHLAPWKREELEMLRAVLEALPEDVYRDKLGFIRGHSYGYAYAATNIGGRDICLYDRFFEEEGVMYESQAPSILSTRPAGRGMGFQIAHEIGHTITTEEFLNLWERKLYGGKSREEPKDLLSMISVEFQVLGDYLIGRRLTKGDPFPSSFAIDHTHEDIAESFALYIWDRARFIEEHPRRSLLIQRLINDTYGVEYLRKKGQEN